MTDNSPVYVTHRLHNIIRELSAIAGDVTPRGRGRIAVLCLTRAMTEIESALRHIEGMQNATLPDGVSNEYTD